MKIKFVLFLIVAIAPTLVISAPLKPAKGTTINSDPLPLKKTDLFEQNDLGWAPELAADPEDYLEEMELPERSAAITDADEKSTQ
jgi:hypothetical protein